MNKLNANQKFEEFYSYINKLKNENDNLKKEINEIKNNNAQSPTKKNKIIKNIFIIYN